ncbi:flavin containing amine oxidoreductase [Aureococcus anophagefferens]|nr:flavin containing amine oxidoreductase [Aureococcus anophagefferens]
MLKTSCAPAPATAPAPKRVAVVGAGWGGLGAAKALAAQGVEVTVLDAGQPLVEMTTESGKPFDLGQRGFWKDYPNLNALGDELGLDPYTDFTESSFFGPEGLEATAPRLPLADRASIAGLLYAMVDLNRTPETFAKYDRMSAHELFRTMRVSERLVEDFLKPTLLVGLFKPPEELSAAVTMELLYFYALAHQTAFDSLEATGLVTIKGGCFVASLDYDGDRVASVTYKEGEAAHTLDVDGVVLALGSTGMKNVMRGSPELAKKAEDLSLAASLDAIDVVAVRIWLDGVVDTDTPVGVLSRFEELRGAGGTFFLLDQLQKDHLDELWAGSTADNGARGSVLSCDFYNAGAIAPLSDDAIVSLLMDTLLPQAYPAFGKVGVADACVKRFPKAVSWFSPGSFSKRPPLATSVPNVVCAGDWVRMGDREHGASGLCQERSCRATRPATSRGARRPREAGDGGRRAARARRRGRLHDGARNGAVQARDRLAFAGAIGAFGKVPASSFFRT